MRRVLFRLIAFSMLLGGAGSPAGAQQAPLPPHAFLFGTWIGGRFPASPNIPAAICHAQPTVIFTADLVMRSAFTQATYVQRVITTVQAQPNGADFHFAPQPANPQMFALDGDSNGFGCANSDTLRVEKRGENQIVFPNCGEFPYPLFRCAAR